MDLYDIDSSQAFLVSVKALIAYQEKLLVLKNTAEKWGRKSRWELPGGLLGIGEGFEEGLVREVGEETGLEVAVGDVVAAWDRWERDFRLADGRVLDVRIVELVFAGQLVGGEMKLSEEHSQFKWASREELKRLNLPSDLTDAIRTHLQSS